MLTKKSQKIVADEICATVVYLLKVKDMTLNDALAGMHAEIMTRIADAYGLSVAAEVAEDIIRQIKTMPPDQENEPAKTDAEPRMH